VVVWEGTEAPGRILEGMSLPTVVAVASGSPADNAGVQTGDVISRMNGAVVRDVIQYRLLADEAEIELELQRGGLELTVLIEKPEGDRLGIEVQSALFDQLRTCDNHCSFCFIYQLPPGMRPSLYLKDDDYRLSFLYGNFTTLTRFTEADLERVITEGLSPLNVSIHATDPEVRADLLRNRRGATSLRWLRALLDHGVEVHGQLVICPGVNDGDVLEDTLAGVLEQYVNLASLHAVPLGISKFNKEPSLRLHTKAEAEAVVDAVERWQKVFLAAIGRRMIFAADEYYLMAERAFPASGEYEDFIQHENGIGMARTLERELSGQTTQPTEVASGFFAWVEGAPAEGYRAPRQAFSLSMDVGNALGPAVEGSDVEAPDVKALDVKALDVKASAVQVPSFGSEVSGCGIGATATSAVNRVPGTISLRPRRSAPVAILTAPYGALVLGELLPPVLEELGRSDVRILPVTNDFFGGNTAVTGLMVGADLARVLAGEPEGHRYLLPDVCLSKGVFLDGTSPADLPRMVEIVPTNGIALREALAQK
jgi:putative radical SAM enzyme (TIGR03279 family)